MIDFDVRSNIKQFTKGLDRDQRRQVPFATARALTRTAQRCQADIQGNIPKLFNTTKKWWLKQQPTGIKITPAKKADLAATVYTRAYFADLQEKGGIKAPFESGGLLVPTDKVPKYGRKSGGAAKVLAGKKIIRRGRKPEGSPIIKTRSGGKGVFRRKNKKTVELLYNYVPRANIRPRFGFARMAHSSAQRHFKPEFEKSLKAALKTAR